MKTNYVNPLISILKYDLKRKSLNDIILMLKEPSCGAFKACSYEDEEIKNNPFYGICKQKIIKNLIILQILSFIF